MLTEYEIISVNKRNVILIQSYDSMWYSFQNMFFNQDSMLHIYFLHWGTKIYKNLCIVLNLMLVIAKFLSVAAIFTLCNYLHKLVYALKHRLASKQRFMQLRVNDIKADEFQRDQIVKAQIVRALLNIWKFFA